MKINHCDIYRRREREFCVSTLNFTERLLSSPLICVCVFSNNNQINLSFIFDINLSIDSACFDVEGSSSKIASCVFLAVSVDHVRYEWMRWREKGEKWMFDRSLFIGYDWIDTYTRVYCPDVTPRENFEPLGTGIFVLLFLSRRKQFAKMLPVSFLTISKSCFSSNDHHQSLRR